MSSLNAFDALRAENVSLQIGQSEIVRNASLTLEPGKTTALLGNLSLIHISEPTRPY